MKKSLLLTSLLATILTACGGGSGSSNSNVITPQIYNGQPPESYAVNLTNGSTLKAVNYMLFPTTQESNILVIHLESQTTNTIDLTSSLPINPTSCTFTNSIKDCAISIKTPSQVASANYFTITPSYNSQSLQNISFSFSTPITQSQSINLNGSWRYSISNSFNPATCEISSGEQGILYVFSGNTVSYYAPDGSYIGTDKNITNPHTLPYTTTGDNNTIEKGAVLANGVLMYSVYSSTCNMTFYTTLTKISN